jgi:hypothetical protein
MQSRPARPHPLTSPWAAPIGTSLSQDCARLYCSSGAPTLSSGAPEAWVTQVSLRRAAKLRGLAADVLGCCLDLARSRAARMDRA